MFEAALDVAVIKEIDGEPRSVSQAHPSWVVVSQDCDLATASMDDAEALIEIRAVSDGVPPHGDWGIRSRRLRLTDALFVDAAAPRLMISPAALSTLVAHRRIALTDDRAKALTTWLGRRYDRPAVPDELVPLVRRIAQEVKRTRTPELADCCHDILIQASDGAPPRYALYAVVVDDADVDAVADWIARAALDVDTELGILAHEPVVVTKAQLTLSVVEGSYSADLTDITWTKRGIRGAV